MYYLNRSILLCDFAIDLFYCRIIGYFRKSLFKTNVKSTAHMFRIVNISEKTKLMKPLRSLFVQLHVLTYFVGECSENTAVVSVRTTANRRII